MSPERYLKERVRTLKIGKCYIMKDWQEEGFALVIVTRLHKQGTYTLGVYTVDRFCLGVKDSFYEFNLDEESYNQFLDDTSGELVEISYNEAHNIIYGALEFAAEGGIKPCKSWALTKYILEEDDDHVPLIDVEMGYHGKHFLVAHNQSELSKYLPILKKNLPEDEIEYILSDNDDDDEEEDDDESKWNTNLVEENVQPKHFEKVPEPTLHHPEVLEILKVDFMKKRDIQKILALPHDTLREDLQAVVRYLMTVKDENCIGGELLNSLLLLGEVGNEDSLRLILDSMRLDIDFSLFYLGHVAVEAYLPALTKLGKDHLDWLFDFLYEKGRHNVMREHIFNAVTMINYNFPEKHDEIIQRMKALAKFYCTALPKAEGCDSATAAWYVTCCDDLCEEELIPEVKSLFATGLVEDESCGLEQEVIDSIHQHKGLITGFMPIDIYEEIKEIKKRFER